jgi:hypothetical protein
MPPVPSAPNPRLTRTQNPPDGWKSFRKYFEYLRKDFADRCCYSTAHEKLSGGPSALHVEHHNPKLPRAERNRYKNLFLSVTHCNLKKGKWWPTTEQYDRGFRLLNPCEEPDYGHHIFEDPTTFELWGATLEGKTHIHKLGLNAPHLVEERMARFILRRSIKKGHFQVPDSITPEEASQALEACKISRGRVDYMIEDFPQKKAPPPNIIEG